jgi:hypothetical protein
MKLKTVEVVHYADGSEETIGGPFPDLCERCPVREGRRPWRHVKVVRPARWPSPRRS